MLDNKSNKSATWKIKKSVECNPSKLFLSCILTVGRFQESIQSVSRDNADVSKYLNYLWDLEMQKIKR